MISLQAKLTAALCAVLFLVGSHWYAYVNGGNNRVAKMERDHSKALVVAIANARRTEQAYQSNIQEALDAAKNREQKLRADAVAARTELGRVRDDLASIRRNLPGLADAAVRQYADTASVVFGECADEYTALAETADRLDSDRQTLIDAWPTDAKKEN